MTTTAKSARGKRRWSHEVTRHSDALDLAGGVFTLKDPRAIARSLSRSAQASHRRKSEPYRSAMSMLNFYINRAGHHLGTRQRRILEQAKEALRAMYGRSAGKKTARKSPRRPRISTS